MEDAGQVRVDAARAAAGLLADTRGAEVLAAIRVLGPDAPATGTPAADDDVAARLGPVRLGIWDVVPTDEGPSLRRTPGVPGETAVLWADVEHVPGPGPARRVVVLGESVARGYLLDPVFTPTRALAHALDVLAPGEAYQCVDLARTSLDLFELRHLIDRLPALAPDVVVVLAGNNWSISCYSRDILPPLATALRAGGPGAFQAEFARSVVEPQVRAVLSDLRTLRDRTGAQVVVVVPEFNLLAWDPVGEADVVEALLLPADDLRDWYAARASAEAALAENRYTETVEFADRMRELDGGVSPVAGHLAGRALLADGDGAAARVALERSRDSLYGTTLAYLPRAPRWLQELLVAFGVEHGMDVVDSRAILSTSGPAGLLPDPDLFYDYVHLTDTGFQRVMTEVARCVAARPAADVPVVSPVEASVRASALLLAAVYNSFCGQSRDAVAAYVERACATDDVDWVIDALAQLVSRDGAAWSDAALPLLTSMPNVARLFDRLAQSRPTVSRLWSLQELLPVRGARRPRGPRDLIEVTGERLGTSRVPNRTPGRCFLQATVGRSSLPFAQPAACPPGPPATLRLTYRTPHAEPGAEIVVAVENREIARLAASIRWAVATLVLPDGSLRPGVNRVHLHWPMPVLGVEARRAEDGDAVARGEFPHLLPVFGEVFEALLTLAAPALDDNPEEIA